MRLVEQSVQGQVHWETALTILNSALTWGSERAVAVGAGVSREYLSRVRHALVDVPALETAERIATSLVRNKLLSPEAGRDLLEQLHLARGEAELIQKRAGQDRDWLGYEAIGELWRVHYLATFSKTPQEARTYYGALLNLGLTLAREFHAARFPLEAARTHSLVQDVLCLLNRPGVALYHARMARMILDSIDPDSPIAERGLAFHDPRSAQDARIDYHELQVNAVRIEAVCNNILGLHAQANQLCDEALQTEAVKRRPADWKSHILRDKLTALSRDPKGQLTDVEHWARQGRAWCEDHEDRLGLDLLDTTLARGYLLRGLDKKAGRLLYQELDRMSHSQEMGQLHKAMLFSRLAAFHRKLGSEEEWRYFMDLALRLSRRAGLTKVASDLAREQGDHPAYGEILEQSAGD